MNVNPRPHLRPITYSDIVNDPPLSFHLPKTSYRVSIVKNIEYIQEHIRFCEAELANEDLSYFAWSYYRLELLKAKRSFKIFEKRASILAS